MKLWDFGFELARCKVSINLTSKRVWGWKIGRCWNRIATDKENGFRSAFGISLGYLYVNIENERSPVVDGIR
jgi:hypothetical protein